MPKYLETAEDLRKAISNFAARCNLQQSPGVVHEIDNMTYGVKDLCERFAVGEHTVLGWIQRGELKAIDVSREGGGKPRWRITQESLAAFELSRTPAFPPPSTRRRREMETQREYKTKKRRT